jgi:hypothetical protein
MANEEKELNVELGEIATYQCSCCGGESETAQGFLFDDTGETTVYFAGYTRGHPVRRANLVLSVGGWGEGTTPQDRRAIAMCVAPSSNGRSFTFPLAESSPWHGQQFLGAMLQPENIPIDERRRYEKLATVAVEKDKRVAHYLAHG